MLTRLSKKKLEEAESLNAIAACIAAQTTGEEPPKAPPPPVKKNPFAVALGKLGASKGGNARAASLSEKRRKEIAKAAASVRWAKKLPEAG
jgi:hypothetical protein